jgi:4-hydroxy-3-methylbut-2-enyl diphosphate reductase
MEVYVAPDAGLCFGVKRALELVHLALRKEKKPLYSLGSLIHNPQVVRELEEKGLISIADASEVTEGTVIIPSHGVRHRVLQDIASGVVNIVDTTCPFVETAQQVAADLSEKGYHIAVIGDAVHPEVVGILGHCKGQTTVIRDERDAARFGSVKKLGIIAQTTLPVDLFRKTVAVLIPKAEEVKVHNTICATTAKRVAGAIELARRVDVMLIVGGKRSANTTRLWETCADANPQSFHIESADELDAAWFRHAHKVGITGGASTPDWVIEEVVAKLKNME